MRFICRQTGQHSWSSPESVYTTVLRLFCYRCYLKPANFERLFRITKPLFKNILETITVHDDYSKQKKDCTGRLGFRTLQKVTASLRILAFGNAADHIDEYHRMGEPTGVDNFKRLCESLVSVFSVQYWSSPITEETKLLLNRG